MRLSERRVEQNYGLNVARKQIFLRLKNGWKKERKKEKREREVRVVDIPPFNGP
jgi:hypothetical protein